MKESDPETKENLWVAHLSVMALGGIFLGEEHLASSTGYAGRPAAASPSACSTRAAFQRGPGTRPVLGNGVSPMDQEYHNENLKQSLGFPGRKWSIL